MFRLFRGTTCGDLATRRRWRGLFGVASLVCARRAAAAAAELGIDVFTRLLHARAPFRGTVRGFLATRRRLS
jgi:hypothetical protein